MSLSLDAALRYAAEHLPKQDRDEFFRLLPHEVSIALVANLLASARHAVEDDE